MKRRLIYFLHTLSIYAHVLSQFTLLYKERARYLSAPSYFPNEGKPKSKLRILIEQIVNVFRYGYLNDFYYLYGFDRKDFRKMNDYVDYALFRRRRDFHNTAIANNHIVVLRDKFLFGLFAECHRIPTPHNIGYFNQSSFVDFRDYTHYSYDEWLETCADGDYFMKLHDGECAEGVYKVTLTGDDIYINGEQKGLHDIEQQVGRNIYLFQRRISNQCYELQRIYDKALNTIRLVTVYDRKDNMAKPFSAVLRVGTGNNSVDNWAKGGLAIGIDLITGRLCKWGYYKPGKGTKVERHPNTDVLFEDY